MKYALSLRRAAAGDLAEAYDYYGAQQAGLGDRFHDEVARILKRIETNPRLYAVSEKSPYRKAALSTFPFCIYYEVISQRIVVIAVHDTRRVPRIWKSRI